jgi:virulence-associated protein VapD
MHLKEQACCTLQTQNFAKQIQIFATSTKKATFQYIDEKVFFEVGIKSVDATQHFKICTLATFGSRNLN